MARFQLHAPGLPEPVDIEVIHEDDQHPDSVRVALGETTVDAELARGRLKLRGRVVPYHAVRDGNAVHLWLAGRTYEFQVIKPTARRAGGTAAAAAAAGTEITAAMPGTVLKVNVKPGDSFEADDSLIVMESMKMEMTLSAPFAGTVKEISCKPGEMVDVGRVLAKLKPRTSNDGAS